MDANEAIQTAHNCVTRAIANEGVNQLNLQEAVQDQDTKKWHIAFRYVRTRGKQDTRWVRGACTIDDASGQMTSITIDECLSCDRKCANQASVQNACSAEQNEQPNRATSTFGWRDSLRSLGRALVIYPGSAVGMATLVVIYVGVNADLFEKALLSAAAFVGTTIGLIVEGRRLLSKRGSQRPDGNRRNRNDR